jgi:hypothetical protein
MKKESSNVNLTISGSNIKFNLPAAADVTIYWDPTNHQMYVIAAGYHQVAVYVTAVTLTPYIYAYYYNSSDIQLTGAWPGSNSYDGSKTVNGYTYKVKYLSIPGDYPFNVIFNNGDNDGCYKTQRLNNGGTITKDTELYYSIDGLSRLAYLGTYGTGWDWSKYPMYNAECILPMASNDGSEKFQIIYAGYKKVSGSWVESSLEAAWHGAENDGTKSVTDGVSRKLAYNTSKDFELGSGVKGYYDFKISRDNSNNAYITVTYPTEYERTSLAAGAWGTVCLPGKSHVDYCTNVKLYSIETVTLDGSSNPQSLILVEEDGELVAGRPYIFQAQTAGSIKIDHNGSTTAGNYNGLYGTISGTTIAAGDAANKYVIQGNQVRPIDPSTGLTLSANRAYIDLTQISGYPTFAPGRRYVEIPMAPQSPTNLDNIEVSETAVKFIMNGQLFIQKNGVVYDMMGTIVK